MKIQCDVCEKAQATVICCADEAALCSKCDVEVHAANKLASKHQRLLLQCLSNKLPPCDVCQEKAAFIFCVEDRAMFCKDCDEPIHSANSRAANHQRFLATGIRVALSSSTCNRKDSIESNNTEPKPPKQPKGQQQAFNTSGLASKSWTVDELLQYSEYESSSKKEQLEFNELEWFSGINFYNEEVSQEALAAAEVPQLSVTSQHHHYTSSYNNDSAELFHGAHKKPRLELPRHHYDDNDEDYLTVPDLG